MIPQLDLVQEAHSVWDRVVEDWLAEHPHSEWRTHSDQVNAGLLARWLPESSDGRLLKTDLFDEIASDGLHSVLASRAGKVCGMDVSSFTARAVARKYPDIAACAADIRRLPFAASSFDTIVSLSTVDHFSDPADISLSLVELQRVLRPGGTLVITLDNLSNPLIALRNSLPYSVLRRVGLVSYPVGQTFTFGRARECVSSAGFTVLESVGLMLAPRVFAIPVLELAARRGNHTMVKRIRHALMWMENFQANTFSRRLAHFVAIRAVKTADRSS
jgi:SAM-dependent methyltransferase